MVNASLYQINTRAFCSSREKKLVDLSQACFKNLKKLGMEYVWFMGIWKTLPKEYVEKYCMTEGLFSEYRKVLPDVSKEDIVGSPFAISDYVLSDALGESGDLKILKEKLNLLGLKLILDFIPNHFGAGTELLKTNPKVFLQVSKEDYQKDSMTFFKSDFGKEKYFAHGKDPNFFAWQDTVQVNYFNEDARAFMLAKLLDIAKVSDGVRCDMAMLAVNNVFEKTWQSTIEKQGLNKPQEEFWKIAIETVKKQYPNFLFIAEVYWDMEWDLQQLGFDFTYDKRLLDRLRYGDVDEIRGHLSAQKDYQDKSVRFIENHDEERSITSLGIAKAKMGAIIISTILGMRFYYDGQFEGRSKRLPVQLVREPDFTENKELKEFYEKLLSITKHKVFKKGNWSLVNPQRGSDDLSYHNILSWVWEYNGDRRLIVVNYSEYDSSCHVKIDFGNNEKIILNDLLNDVSYERNLDDLNNFGLFVSLSAYNAHIFQILP